MAVVVAGVLSHASAHADNAPPSGADGSLFAKRWKLDEPASVELFDLMPHRAVWILPLSYNQNPNVDAFRDVGLEGQMDRVEFLYQLSFKTALVNGLFSPRVTLWAGYTQKAYWQAYNVEESVPFREINHEPEVIYAYRTNWTARTSSSTPKAPISWSTKW